VRLPRLSPRAYQRIVLIAVITLVVIVVTGAAVRLTGSGLGDRGTAERRPALPAHGGGRT
jgi:heme A synthase